MTITPFALVFGRCYPLRVKYSSWPYTLIMRDDIYDNSGELATKESTREIDRLFQELAHLQAWVSKTKTADIEVVAQSLVSLKQYQQDMVKRYSVAPSSSAFTRVAAVASIAGTSYLNNSRVYNLLEPLQCVDFAAPRLFLVLPSDLDSWNDEDVTTHSFRLYFLCDFKYRTDYALRSRSVMSRSEISPKHIHISGHRGYDIKRPEEFFHKLGHFSLEVLKTIKDGYLDEDCYVPTLSTYSILKCCEGAVVDHHLTKDKLEQMVDKSIAYIQHHQSAFKESDSATDVLDDIWGFVQNWLPQQYRPRIWMNGPETRQIQSFLHLLDGDNGMGGLLQTLYPFHDNPARWLCPGHAFEHSSVEAINKLIRSEGGQIRAQGVTANTQHWHTILPQPGVAPCGFLIHQNEWHVDLQLGAIAVSLSTPQHVRRFTHLLADTKRTFDLTIHLAWGPTRTDIKEVLLQLVDCKIRVLEIDATNLNFLRHSPLEYTRDLFVEHVEKAMWRPGQFLVLLGHPQESQSYMYLGVAGPMVYGFVLGSPTDKCSVDWWDVQNKLYKFYRDLVDTRQSTEVLTRRMVELSAIVAPLMPLGLQGVDLFTFWTGFWGVRFGVEDGAIRGAVASATPFLTFRLTDFVHATLRRVIVQYNMPAAMELLYLTMDRNPTLQKIDAPARESEMCMTIETIGRRWCGGPNPIEVTIFEQDMERTGRVLATVMIKKDPYIFEKQLDNVQSAIDGKSAGKIFTKEDEMTIEIKHWDCSNISGALTDRDAIMLGIATRAHPTSLESFTFNLSRLSDQGMASVQSVLHQSILIHLNIECTELDSSKERNLGQVLGAVKWSTIKSVTLFGNHIDAWISIWAAHDNLSNLPTLDHQLASFGVVGSEFCTQVLSHSSAMWLHNMIYSFSPMEVHLENIRMKESGDWKLIRNTLNDVSPKRFGNAMCL